MQSNLTIVTNANVAISFTELYEQYYTVAVRHALKFVPSLSVAKDVAQEVFTRILEKDIYNNAVENWKSYLFILVRNELVNYLRREKLQRKLMNEEMWRSQDITTHDKLLEKEYRKVLQAAMERLPEKRRIVFQLSFELGMKSDAIANVLHISKRTVKCQLQIARKEVRSYMRLLRA